MLDGGDASDIKKCNASMNESNILLDSFISVEIRVQHTSRKRSEVPFLNEPWYC